MRDGGRLEERYRELEGRREVALAVRVRRGQVGLLAALLAAVLLAAGTAAVDLRRLQTPLGTARAWSEATVFGDCDRSLALSVPAVPADGPARASLCRALAERSAVARDPSSGTRVTTRLVSRAGRRAVVRAVVTADNVAPVSTELQLRRQGDDWRVVRDDDACRIGC